MRIAIFGANGGIGRWAVKYAIDSGYDVTVYVRRKSTRLPESEKIKVVIGTTDERQKIQDAIQYCNAVINCIGVSMHPFTDDKAAAKSNQDIIAAMKTVGVKRYITWATPSISSKEDKNLL